jgi:hypothetical protein
VLGSRTANECVAVRRRMWACSTRSLARLPVRLASRSAGHGLHASNVAPGPVVRLRLSAPSRANRRYSGRGKHTGSLAGR